MAESTFKDEFEHLAGFLGGTVGDQIEALGEPDDRDRNFVWFKSVNASFCWHNGRVVQLYVPTKDAFCHSYEGSPHPYTIGGLRPGMTKAQSLQIWGTPTLGADNASALLWNYGNKILGTRSGDKAFVSLSFDTEDHSSDEHALTYFGATLMDQPGAGTNANFRERESDADNENVLFDRDGILITNLRVVIRGNIIPLRAIASVDAYQLKQSHKGPMMLYGLTLLPMCAGKWLLALAMAAVGAIWQFSQIKNPKYALSIRTVAGDGKCNFHN